MEKIAQDLFIAEKLISTDWGSLDRDLPRLYARTNEDLSFLFSNFDVYDQDVLSVLASSDQYFSCCYQGAHSVDTFDVNPLTKYYYYLRKWALEMSLELNPQDYNNFYLDVLLEQVPIRFEQEEAAKKFFSTLLERYDPLMRTKLFYPVTFSAKVPFSKDPQGLLSVLSEKALPFSCQNIFTPMNVEKQYDTVILSNILDYSNSDISKLIICRDNLYSLLKENGIVVCSYLKNWHEPYSFHFIEREIFEEKFLFLDGKCRYSSLLDDYLPSYYVYQKR